MMFGDQMYRTRLSSFFTELFCEERARHRKKEAQVVGQLELVYAVAVRANMRSILVAMIRSHAVPDLLCLQRDRRIAPTEADIRVMAFNFHELTNLLNKGKRLPEIAKPEAPLDAVSFLRQLPVWGLCVKELGLLVREWRYSPATGSTGFAGKSFGRVACPSCRRRPH
jgi:hypothetical protein